MFFSIITVALNAGASLVPTVTSVLEQRCSDWELIIKDGGSNDGSLGGIPDDPRIRVIEMPDNGIYDAMNQALDCCGGRYVLYLNAGDCLYDPNVLLETKDQIEHEDYNFVYGFVYNKRLRSEIRYPDKLTNFFLFRNTICHQVQFLSIELLRKLGGYDTRYKLRADWAFYLRANKLGLLRPKRLCRLIANYDGAGLSTSRSQHALLAYERQLILRENFNKITLILYSLFHALTFVKLRKKLKYSRRFEFLKDLMDKMNHYLSR